MIKMQADGKFLRGLSCSLLMGIVAGVGFAPFAIILSNQNLANASELSNSEKWSSADKAFAEGVKLYQQGTEVSRRQAAEKFQEALTLLESLGDEGAIATALSSLGTIYNQSGESKTALEYFNRAIPLLEKMGNRPQMAATLNIVGTIYFNLGQPQPAIAEFQKALSIYQELGDISLESATLYNLGNVYQKLGEKQKALEYYTQALDLIRQVGNRLGEAFNLNNIGSIYWSLGEYQQALNFQNQALKIYEELGNLNGKAITLNNIGSVYWALGEQQQALEHYQQAIPAYQQSKDQKGEAAALHNLGSIYYKLGALKEAFNSLNQALKLSQEIGDSYQQAATLSGLGTIYNGANEPQKALDYYNQALPLTRTTGDRAQEAVTLSAMGKAYDDLQQEQKALEYYQQALPLRQAVGDRAGEANTLNNIGKVYAELQQNSQAVEYYQKALTLSEKIGDRSIQATTLLNLAFLERQQNNLEKALNYIENAIKIVEVLRTKVNSTELRASYFASVQNFYEVYINILMELHKKQPEKGYNSQALHASEQAKARTLIELLTEANADIRQGVSPDLLEQERSLQQKFNALEEQRIQTLKTNPNEEQIKNLQQQEETLLNQYKTLENQIRSTSPRYAALTQPQPLTVSEIQQQLLDEKTILLQYFLGNKKSYLWAVTKTEVTSYELPPKVEIEAIARQLLNKLTSSRFRENVVQLTPSIKALTQVILAPVAPQLQDKRLLIVADGVLQYLPFVTLTEPTALAESDPYQPLIIQHEVVHLPSASTLAILRREVAGRQPAPKAIAVLADPVFSPKDTRVKASNSTSVSNQLPLEAQQVSRAADQAKIDWDRLPGTRQEAETILALVPNIERSSAFDFQASRERATSAELSQYRIIHFATHGFVNSQNPELSAIVMSLVNQQGEWQNGYLRLRDVYNLNLPAELVVLSACQTGLGKQIKGEGLIGLTRGFMYAGASRVVASLWYVDDQATARLMSKFYTGILSEGLSPSAALRSAQLELWQNQQWQAPYFWAAFALQGEWK